MDIETALKNKLVQVLGDVHHVNVINEPGSCSSAAKVIVTVVSSRFEGVGRLQRHRMVHEALAEEIKSQLHAITIKAQAPSEI